MIARSSNYSPIMSTSANPSTNYLRLITEYYATQDGKVLYTQLWQLLTTFVNARVIGKQTLENLKSTVERANKHVNAMRATQRANVEALDNYTMKEARDTIRQTPQKLAAFDRANDTITEAYNNRKKITKDKYLMAEESSCKYLHQQRHYRGRGRTGTHKRTPSPLPTATLSASCIKHSISRLFHRRVPTMVSHCIAL